MNSTTNSSNLTEKSFSFPDPPLFPEIPVDSKIREIKKKFSQGNLSIVLEGSIGSGKTIMLYQFTKLHQNNSFSYFLSDNYWTVQPSTFLSSLCSQMSEFLGNRSRNFRDVIDDQKIDLERLKILFSTLAQKIVEVAKREKQEFYFVIDGLEWAGNPPVK